MVKLIKHGTTVNAVFSDGQQYQLDNVTNEPTVLFNLNVTKEIGNLLTASFYVNNMFNHRPLYKRKRSDGYTELGIPMFFGFEFKVNIR